MSNGGVDIYNFACDATALCSFDSLAVIEKFVVGEKLTWKSCRPYLKTIGKVQNISG